MQFIFFCLFAIICSYSLVISVPINQNSQEIKHEKASDVANRLLKELTDENLADEGLNTESEDYFKSSDEDSSPETNDMDQELIKHLDEVQKSFEDFILARQSPIMDDKIMKI